MTLEGDFETLKGKLQEMLGQKPFVLLAIDGYGGSGKTTLSAQLQKDFPGSVGITFDDFATSTDGGADRQRLLEQVLIPLHEGKSTKYQKFNWQLQKLDSWVSVAPKGLVILDGVSVLVEDLCPYYDLRVWIDVQHEIASSRGMDRDKSVYKVDHDEKWEKLWIPEEKEYAKTEPWKRADVIFKNV